jgi:hypothetical protein
METPKEYDLEGIDGAQTFRDLPEGLKIKLTNGAVGEIVGNPRDGAYLLIRFLESPEDPSKVGEEEIVYMTEIAGVL